MSQEATAVIQVRGSLGCDGEKRSDSAWNLPHRSFTKSVHQRKPGEKQASVKAEHDLGTRE